MIQAKAAFTTTSSFPDVNVWLAIASTVHAHHQVAKNWFDGVSSESGIYFSRITQLGLLRTLSTPAVMGVQALTQHESWQVYEDFLSDERVHFGNEKAEIIHLFRAISDRDEVSPKRWTDDYLLAFAQVNNLRIVTFDRALAGRAGDCVLLRAEKVTPL